MTAPGPGLAVTAPGPGLAVTAPGPGHAMIPPGSGLAVTAPGSGLAMAAAGFGATVTAPRILAVAGPPPSDLPPAQAAKLWQAAKTFEGMTLGALLAPIFKTVHSANGPFGGGNAEATWRPMLVSAIGKEIAAGGGLGLAVPVFRAMLAAQEARHPAPPKETPR
ncbi:MAG: rod-binding protein [Acetobacteraceae bacterium]